jgi:glutathione S-transferase
MKLYDHSTAPNPRRVRVYLAEKGIEIERVEVDLMAQEHKTPEFLQKNLNGQIPMLELDDGECISESVSICRYLEALHPQPSMFGTTALEIAKIDMHLRRIELVLGRAITTSWVNGPVVAKVAAGRFVQIPEAKKQSDVATHAYYKRLDGELAQRPMIAGDAYSIVDITAMCLIDFAEAMVGLAPSTDLEHLARWRAAVAGRPSARA